MGKGTPPPVSLVKVKTMMTHNTQAQQSNAAPASNAMNARKKRLRLGKQTGYRITEAKITKGNETCEAARLLNASSFSRTTVSGGQRKHGKNARKRARPNYLPDNCGVNDLPNPWSVEGLLA